MLILSCPSKLQLLEGILRKSLPQTLSVHGAVMNINRGNPAGHEVLVDSWPKFKAVLTRPCRECLRIPVTGRFGKGNSLKILKKETLTILGIYEIRTLIFTAEPREAVETLNQFLKEVLQWMWANKLKLNSDKMEVLLVATDDSDFYTNMYAAFYHDLDAYQALLQDKDTVNWAQAFRIHGHQDGLYEASRDAAATKQVQFAPSSYFTYLHPDPNRITARQLDPHLRFSTLNSSHVDLLDETWPYGGSEHSRGYLATLVRSFPSRCILDSNGRLISWSMFDPFGAMAHGYTLPEYRGHGYITIVNKVLSVHVHASGYPVYGNVALDNVRMQKLNEHWGYQRLAALVHIIIHNPKSSAVS